MTCYDSILGCIGNTPLVKLDRLSQSIGLNPGSLLGKVEYLNPGGSIKDRIGLYMIEDAEKKGRLKAGSTLIEATSGNTGLAIAMIAAAKGYKSLFVMPDKTSSEKQDLLKVYGAKIVLTRTTAKFGDPDHYMCVAERIAKETPNSFWLSQFTNPFNPKAHYLTTGPEIWKDSEGKVQALVGSVGTGGTVSGAGRYLKEQNSALKIVIGDPEGSIIAGCNPDHEPEWLVEGIGEDYFPDTYDKEIGDVFYHIPDQESFSLSKLLCQTEGILSGGSAGTNLAAAIRYVKDTNKSWVVVILPDSGRSYLSKQFDKTWLKQQDITLALEDYRGKLMEE